jgi:hypothetical protein
MRRRLVFLAAAVLALIAPHDSAAAAGAACPAINITTYEFAPQTHRVAFQLVVTPLPPGPVTYAWTVSSGRITRGANTVRPFVEGQGPVTATVRITGMPAGCPSTGSSTFVIK